VRVYSVCFNWTPHLIHWIAPVVCARGSCNGFSPHRLISSSTLVNNSSKLLSIAILVNATSRLSQLPEFWLLSSSLIGELCLAIPEVWAQFQLCSGKKQWQDLGTWLAGQKLEQTPRLYKLSQFVVVNCSIKRKLTVVKFSCPPWPPSLKRWGIYPPTNMVAPPLVSVLGLIHFTSVPARYRLFIRSVTYLSQHRQTDPGSQRPVFPGGHPSKY